MYLSVIFVVVAVAESVSLKSQLPPSSHCIASLTVPKSNINKSTIDQILTKDEERDKRDMTLKQRIYVSYKSMVEQFMTVRTNSAFKEK
jgi:hypothetical protein